MSNDLGILRGERVAAVCAYASPAIVLTGSRKLATKVASLLLRPYDPIRKRGTGLIAAMQRGQITTDAAVVSAFAVAALDILDQLGDQSAQPPSEQIERLELTNHALFSSTLALTVRIHTPGGVTDFTIPVAT
jgi:hypothetical protein